MSFSEIRQTEREILDQLLESLTGDSVLLLGSDDASFITKAPLKAHFTSHFFYTRHLKADGVFSFEAFPFKEGVLDNIVLYHSFNLTKFPGKLLKEIYFSLKEGGRLIVVHGNSQSYASQNYIRSHYQKLGLPVEMPFHKHSLKRISELLKLYGFSYEKAHSIMPLNAFKKILSNFMMQFILGWVMVYQKQAKPLTPFRLKEKEALPKGKYALPQATARKFHQDK